MFWSTLIFTVPALALAAAVWGVLRRKWYGFVPVFVVGIIGWSWEESWWLAGKEFLDSCVNRSAVSEVMLLLLASGAAVMALSALWTGWSRGWWFWRAMVFAAVPASLVPLEANEFILLCLITMPVLAAVAWFCRRLADRRGTGEPRRQTDRQFSLANLFLGFIVLGLLASSLRSVLVGHIILADWGLVWLATSIVAAALAAASPALARGSGRKWLVVWTAAAAIGVASWWWLHWNSDPLGLVAYFQWRPGMAIPVNLIEGELCFVLLVGFFSTAYSLVERMRPQLDGGRNTTVYRAALVVLSLLFVVPLALIYPVMIPPRTAIGALPPSKEYELIRRAAFKLYDLGLLRTTANPSTPVAVAQKPVLAVLDDLDREVSQPGHITYDVSELAHARVRQSNADDPKYSLKGELCWEILRAVHDERHAEAIRLSRLQWRIAQTHYRGGTILDYFYGFGGDENSSNRAIMVEAPLLSDEECRKLLGEAQTMEAPDLDYETVKEYDDYWISVTSGWRDRLQETAVWLTGNRNPAYTRMTADEFNKLRKRPLGSIRVVEYVLALELYHRKRGEWPESLSSVQAEYDLPELLDPYTKFPPIYRRTSDGFLLYSVGLDGKDDGGNFAFQSFAIPAETASQDINLVPDRELVSAQWRGYWLAITKPALPPAAPAPPATEPSTAK